MPIIEPLTANEFRAFDLSVQPFSLTPSEDIYGTEPCPTCSGSGFNPDKDHTFDNKPCTQCLGARRVPQKSIT